MAFTLAELTSRYGVALHELNGAAMNGELPLPASLVNRIVAQQLAQKRPDAEARIEPHDGQRLDITVAMRGQRLLPTIRIAARIEQQPQFPGPAVLGLRWSMPAMGPLSLFAGPALSFFKVLPPGIQADGDRLWIDIRELLHRQGLGELAGLITALEVVTREGAFLVRFSARIPPPRS